MSYRRWRNRLVTACSVLWLACGAGGGSHNQCYDRQCTVAFPHGGACAQCGVGWGAWAGPTHSAALVNSGPPDIACGNQCIRAEATCTEPPGCACNVYKVDCE